MPGNIQIQIVSKSILENRLLSAKIRALNLTEDEPMNRTTRDFLEASRRHFGLRGLLRSLLFAGSIGATLGNPSMAAQSAATRPDFQGNEATMVESARPDAHSLESMP